MTFASKSLCTNTSATVGMLFRLLGWEYADVGDKAMEFSHCFSALGIVISLDKFSEGVVEFANTDKGRKELSNLISVTVEKGTMSLLEAQKLRGRMQFSDSQLFGRCGKLCLRAVTEQAYGGGSEKISAQCEAALLRFDWFLNNSPPRTLKLCTDSAWFVFTDACFDRDDENWTCGLGGIIYDAGGRAVEYFSHNVCSAHLELLGASVKKTVIFETELLAVVLAIILWSGVLRCSQTLVYVDNNAARDVVISGCARNEAASILIEKLLAAENEASLFPWYCRVPSPSNPSDDASRGCCNSSLYSGVKHVGVNDLVSCIMKSFG